MFNILCLICFKDSPADATVRPILDSSQQSWSASNNTTTTHYERDARDGGGGGGGTDCIRMSMALQSVLLLLVAVVLL